jgi:hypothetical protein
VIHNEIPVVKLTKWPKVRSTRSMLRFKIIKINQLGNVLPLGGVIVIPKSAFGCSFPVINKNHDTISKSSEKTGKTSLSEILEGFIWLFFF